jgi:hypothetical protein
VRSPAKSSYVRGYADFDASFGGIYRLMDCRLEQFLQMIVLQEKEMIGKV